MYGANPAAGEVVDALAARRSAGFSVPGEAGRDTTSFLPYPHHLHEIDRHLALVRTLGAEAGDRTLEFPVRRADERAAAEVRAHSGLYDRPYALLHPGATSPSRRWPPARWARVADGLVARGLAVGITGVRGEESLVRETRGRMRAPAADLCGRTSLGAFAALVAGAALVVGNDSGPAHLAAALGTPSVTVFLAGAAVIATHIRLPPGVPDPDPVYEDVVEDVANALRALAHRARAAGIPADRIVLDPGYDLGKTWQQTLALLAHTPRFAALGHPLLIAVSNKIFLGRLLDLPLEERGTATTAACAYAVTRGARVMRVHDALAGRQVAELLAALLAAEDGTG